MGTVYAKELPAGAATSPIKDAKTDFGKEVQLMGVAARVDKVHVEGLQKTKDDVIVESVQELFSSQDFSDVIMKSRIVKGKLESLGCFRNISVFIDTSSGKDASPDGLEVTFFVKELRPIVGGVNTMVGNNEGSLVVGLKAPNMLGRGERLQAEYSYGSRRTNNFNVTFLKPLRTNYDLMWTSSLFQHCSDWPWSGYRLIERGVLFDIGFTSAPTVKHNIQYEASWREMGTPSKTSAFEIREGNGHTLKSSLRHTLAVDRRDQAIFPTRGTFLRFNTELAGLGGNVGFLRNDAYLQLNFPLPSDIVLQGTLHAGVLTPMFDDKTQGIPDRFFMGGPMSVRGFETRGLGPRAGENAVGAKVAWGSGLHLFTPLPFRPGQGGLGDLFKLHFFTNFGHCDDFRFTEDYTENARMLFRGYRLSYGLGLALRLGQLARVELNYVVPHIYEASDMVTHGLQFGLGLQFL